MAVLYYIRLKFWNLLSLIRTVTFQIFLLLPILFRIFFVKRY